MLKNNFEIEINKFKYHFELIDYNDVNRLMYHVTFFDEKLGKNETFRVKPDEDGMFKMQAQVLPKYVHESELDFQEAIEDNRE